MSLYVDLNTPFNIPIYPINYHMPNSIHFEQNPYQASLLISLFDNPNTSLATSFTNDSYAGVIHIFLFTSNAIKIINTILFIIIISNHRFSFFFLDHPTKIFRIIMSEAFSSNVANISIYSKNRFIIISI